MQQSSLSLIQSNNVCVPGDYLGGEAYWAGGLHLYTPLPFRPGKGGFGDLFRTHFFLNAGNLCNLNYGGWTEVINAQNTCDVKKKLTPADWQKSNFHSSVTSNRKDETQTYKVHYA